MIQILARFSSFALESSDLGCQSPDSRPDKSLDAGFDRIVGKLYDRITNVFPILLDLAHFLTTLQNCYLVASLQLGCSSRA